MMTKKEIVSELADRADLSRRAAETYLDALTELVYREAENGFTLPGLCRFKVSQRKETRRYNVVTGQHYTVAAHKVLKVVPLKVARNAVAPVPDDVLVADWPDEEVDGVSGMEETIDGKPVHDPDLELPPTYLPHIAAIAVAHQAEGDPAGSEESTATAPSPMPDEAHEQVSPPVASAPEPDPASEPPAAKEEEAPPDKADAQEPPLVAAPLGADPSPEDEEDAPPPRVETPNSDPLPAAEDEDEETFDFPCPHCGETLSARPQDGGEEGVCPECRGEFRVPDISPITQEIKMEPSEAVQTRPVESKASLFVTFFCNECGQQIEAPQEMIGLQADCPACGSRLQVPQQGSAFDEAGSEEIEADEKKLDDPSMTVRMDLSDFLS